MTLTTADRLALSDLVHRYAAYVDARRFDDVVELFSPTAELILPNPPESLEPCVPHVGGDRIRGAMSALSAQSGITRTQHGIVGEVYDGDGDFATGAITAVAHHWISRDDGITDLTWYLRYTDVYRRTDRGWRITLRSLAIDAIATGSARRVRT